MDLKILISNPVLNSCIISWFFAQGIKTIINIFVNKKFDKKKLTSAGGMPSSHSAVVCSVLLTSLFQYGYASFEFAIAFVLALIVMYDATGVRWAAGLHAKSINNLVEYLSKSDHEEQELDEIIPKLNESLGHRVIEVICGAGLGISISVIIQLVNHGSLSFI